MCHKLLAYTYNIFFVYLYSNLQYELEREKLEMELEEERRSHKEREQRIRDQQLKIENLSSLVSDGDRCSSQVHSVCLWFLQDQTPYLCIL